MGGLFDLPGIYKYIVMPLPHMHSLCSVNHEIPVNGVGHNNRRCEIIQSGANVTWDRSIRVAGHHGSSALNIWSKILTISI